MITVFWTMDYKDGQPSVDHYAVYETQAEADAQVETLKGWQSCYCWGMGEVQKASEPHWTLTEAQIDAIIESAVKQRAADMWAATVMRAKAAERGE